MVHPYSKFPIETKLTSSTQYYRHSYPTFLVNQLKKAITTNSLRIHLQSQIASGAIHPPGAGVARKLRRGISPVPAARPAPFRGSSHLSRPGALSPGSAPRRGGHNPICVPPRRGSRASLSPTCRDSPMEQQYCFSIPGRPRLPKRRGTGPGGIHLRGLLNCGAARTFPTN